MIRRLLALLLASMSIGVVLAGPSAAVDGVVPVGGREQVPLVHGTMDESYPVPGGVFFRGWTTLSSVDISIDSGSPVTVPTGDPRPDVQVALGGSVGPDQGWHVTVTASPGRHLACVSDACFAVTVLGGSPIGSLDAASSARDDRSLAVSGWAIDPDVGGPIDVHLYLDGRILAVPADRSAYAVGVYYPGYGPAHLFAASLGITPGYGHHQLCAYGINVGAGTNTSLGCSQWDIVPHAPVGSLDTVDPVPGAVHVRGWTIDTDVPEPGRTKVHLYVDGAALQVTADAYRPDVQLYATGWDAYHGYDAVLGASPGLHRVCAYGIDDDGAAPNTSLGCRTVTVG